jgi:hypothetical protein
MDIEGPQLYRAAQITQYVASITRENAEEWYDIVKHCASVKSDDMATFPSFGEFLKQLAARSPDIAIGYLKEDDQVLNNFIPAILGGLAEGARPEEGLSLVTGWIDGGEHLAVKTTNGAATTPFRRSSTIWCCALALNITTNGFCARSPKTMPESYGAFLRSESTVKRPMNPRTGTNQSRTR